jgi:xanthine dehydrogenase accessory factor
MIASDHEALNYVASNPAALCTIVGIEGSFSRRCGAQLAVGRDGTRIGDMADNCLDAELAGQAADALGSGEVRLLRYGNGSPFIDFRLPCGSGLDILVDPAPDRASLVRCLDDLTDRHEAVLPLPLPAGTNAELLRERRYMPALRLILLGSGPECAALGRLAAAQQIDVEWRQPGPGDGGLALNRSPSGLRPDRWTAIILLFHDHEWEHALIEWALRTPAFYIGAQGGAQARIARIERLLAAGYGEADIGRLRSPIGLIPRARDPTVLALSILAELVGAYEALHPHQ